MTENFELPYCRHNIGNEEINSVIETLSGDWLTLGPKVNEFELELSAFNAASTCVLSSGTAALHSIFSSLDIKPGDEVIAPANTFVATQATAVLAGAEIVFADIQEDTGNVDPDHVKTLITNRTRAIVGVDFAGHPCDLDEMVEIARNCGALFIEDAAHSIGSTYKGKNVGSQADLTAFSFFATKNLTTGEGGAVASKNEKLLQKIKRFSRQGVVREINEFERISTGPWYYEVKEFGLNYRLPDILSAIGLIQLKRIESFKEFRWKLFRSYLDFFSEFEFVSTPVRRDYVNPMWHLYPIKVPSEIRNEIFRDLHNSGIKVQVNYIPSYFHPAFDRNKYPKGLCPESEKFYEREISMPMFVNDYLLSNEYFERLSDVFSKYN